MNASEERAREREYCRNWAMHNIPYCVELNGLSLHKDYISSLPEKGFDLDECYIGMGVFRQRLNGYDFLSHTQQRDVRKCGDGQNRSFLMNYYSKIEPVKEAEELVAQDARPCFCKRNAERFRRLASWAKSLILRT